jgi:hypothetical protein
MEELDLGGDLTYNERPIKILDMVEHMTRSKVIKMCKVQWIHHTEDCHTPFQDSGNEASIRVLRMFHSHV